ncbi:MAG: SDR family oxidoreductase [bacterium]|nr:SDR family oxidoreductase [bacterium]
MFRKRVDRIRGIAGSLDGVTTLIIDAATQPGPGILKVVAEAGSTVFAASGNPAMLDVEVGRLGGTPVAVSTVAGTVDDFSSQQAPLPDEFDSLVLNPPITGDVAEVQPFLALASRVADNMRDRGRIGSIVFVSTIERPGPEGSVAGFLQAEMANLAGEFAPNGIRANAVAMGPIGANRRGNPLSSRATPLGHTTVHPVEVGKAVWFLINEQLSAGITGSTVTVDRGASLLRPDW